MREQTPLGGAYAPRLRLNWGTLWLLMNTISALIF